MGFPLEGIRIADLSQVWAGPYATRLLADMGAQVIKIEVARRYDVFRGPMNPPKGVTAYPDGDPGERPWNRCGFFNSLNLNKMGVTLDLAIPSGKKAFLCLVAISDVVIENFRYGVTERLGLSYKTLCQARPDIIVVSMPAFGNSGPWRHYIGYGVGQEQMSGMAHMTGYPGDMPMKSGINHGDPITGSHAASAILAALLRRRRTGKGAFIDISHMESSVSLMGEHMLGFQMTGRNPERMGNRIMRLSPFNSYPARDGWLIIATGTEAHWHDLLRVIGRGDLIGDARYADMTGRLTHNEEIDDLIGEWTKEREVGEAVRLLREGGVICGPVRNIREILAWPHLRERGMIGEVHHPTLGPLPGVHAPGFPIKLEKSPGGYERPAPLIGAHNDEIFGGLLGIDKAGRDRLKEEGII